MSWNRWTISPKWLSWPWLLYKILLFSALGSLYYSSFCDAAVRNPRWQAEENQNSNPNDWRLFHFLFLVRKCSPLECLLLFAVAIEVV